MKKGNREAILERAIKEGYIVIEEVSLGETSTKKYRNRSLREVLEHRITSKEMTKKAVLSYLAERLKTVTGTREKARLESLVKHINDFKVKESKAEKAETTAAG
jgi:hypothetical protein